MQKETEDLNRTSTANNMTACSAKIILGAVVWFLPREINSMAFENIEIHKSRLFKEIVVIVKLKLVTCLATYGYSKVNQNILDNRGLNINPLIT